MACRQVAQVVNALVAMWQTEQIHEEVERRQNPGEEAIAEEVAIDCAKCPASIAHHIDEAEQKVNHECDGNPIDPEGEWNDNEYRRHEESLDRLLGVAKTL